MTTARAYKLQSTTRCPCCGADRIMLDIDTAKTRATVIYKCLASFTITNGEITVAGACHAGTNLAAHLMNAETMRSRGEVK
ncbi:hypothetical protein GOZ97_07665 [Agrobacterium vitis]|uniref:hypothetical protein n=1 Tax=Agrobacterium vitis TaxID=373 RepID=UPI0008FB8D9B|nr:hypothetical protein [Agrobacterium vitis]MUZ53075.1 hypothetical protein [Agrobacterium vitis]MUZ91294.1 hypothetical protein [Agrobacterium vitis]MVA40262.1 hypothetical protein [Agrobacterium vitis]NSX96108.1 hypothetical protein [Agrobacterium vitis]NSZ27247.1 hypothetical protein [Agrobacterium vitis]